MDATHPTGTGDPWRLAASPAWARRVPLTVESCERAFEHAVPFTVGVEEELMLLDPESYELTPSVDEALELLGGDERFTRELRTTQLEIVTRVSATAPDACRALAAARRFLVGRLAGRMRILASGTHPFSSAWGEITDADRYRQIADEYTWAASRSIACGLHVHVAVDGAARALAVYNSLRSYLPELAALGANSAFVDGRDIGMSSIRPKLNEGFPRSGIPPAFGSWAELVRFVEWGRSGGLFPDATHLWWELRPHPDHGTLEIRVADAQTRVEDAAAIVAVVQALVARLADRHDAGDPLPAHESYRIRENAWRAYRYGVRGWIVDLDDGVPVPTRERLARVLDEVEPYAARFDAREHVAAARTLLAGNGSDRQRYVYERSGLDGLTRWLADETEASALDG